MFKQSLKQDSGEAAMGDYHVLMQFDIDADSKSVAEAIGSRAGVAGWWSDAVDGDPGTPGRRFEVRFPDAPQAFAFGVTAAGDQRIEWRVGDFPPWWAETTIRWELSENPDGPGTRLLFSHRDFDPDNPIIPVITPAWAQIILRLKSFAETGRPNPFFTN
jgi:hypothetical protein